MCIYCNGTTLETAGEFLYEFMCARVHMKKATSAMLQASKSATSVEQRLAYNRAHKRMVKISRNWNQIEHEREIAVESVTLGESK